MSSLPATVADLYRYVLGVDTHAGTHSYAIVATPSGALIDQATFPTTPAGLRRARDWIGRRTEGDLERSHDLCIDGRKALRSQQITTIAGWRRREESFGVATARAEAVRLAKRILTPDEELAENRATITSLVAAEAPELLELH